MKTPSPNWLLILALVFLLLSKNTEQYLTTPTPTFVPASGGSTMKPADNSCQVIRVGNSYSVDPYDPDCASGTATANKFTMSNGGFMIAGPNNQSMTMVVNSDGTSTITVNTPAADGSTEKTVATISAPAANGDSTLTGVSTSTVAGNPGTGSSDTPAGQTTSINTGAMVDKQTETNTKLTDTNTKLDQIKEKIGEEAPSIPSLPSPAQGDFYTRKYPDGLIGVWQSKSASLTATPFFGALANMVPNFGSGSCPTWTMNFNINSKMNFGSGDITVPCALWNVVGSIILLSAAFYCRRIIFGG